MCFNEMEKSELISMCSNQHLNLGYGLNRQSAQVSSGATIQNTRYFTKKGERSVSERTSRQSNSLPMSSYHTAGFRNSPFKESIGNAKTKRAYFNTNLTPIQEEKSSNMYQTPSKLTNPNSVSHNQPFNRSST